MANECESGPANGAWSSGCADEMKQVAFWYPASADFKEAIVPDFHSFRQALNVASADQRVLVLVHAPPEQEKNLRQSLRAVANDQRIIGRFHFDFDQGDSWKKNIEGTSDEPGIILINPGEFGMAGKVMRHIAPRRGRIRNHLCHVRCKHSICRDDDEEGLLGTCGKGTISGHLFRGRCPLRRRP